MDIELEARLLQQIVNVVKSLDADELSLSAGTYELRCIQVDSAHIAMADIRIPHTAFSKYEHGITKLDEVGKKYNFDLDKIQDTLKLADPKDKIGLGAHPQGDSAVGQITLGPVTRYCGVNMYDSQTKAPNIKYKTRINIPTKPFYQGIKAAASTSADEITLFTNKDGFFMETDPSASDCIRFDGSVLGTVIVDGEKTPEKTDFSLDYLVKMIECIPSAEINFGLLTDHPLEVVFPICDIGKATYFIAPAPKRADKEK